MDGPVIDPSFERQIAALRTGLGQFKDKTQFFILRGATRTGLRVLRKSIQGEIPSEWKQIKPLIGMRMLRSVKGTDPAGKVGVAVGKVSKARQKKLDARTAAYKAGEAKGVGIGPKTVHWFVMGTKDRTVAKTGKFVGKMPPQVPNIVKDGVARGYPKALQAMIAAVQNGIEREAKKLSDKVRQAGGL
jgi:hypothetical protein